MRLLISSTTICTDYIAVLSILLSYDDAVRYYYTRSYNCSKIGKQTHRQKSFSLLSLDGFVALLLGTTVEIKDNHTDGNAGVVEEMASQGAHEALAGESLHPG